MPRMRRTTGGKWYRMASHVYSTKRDAEKAATTWKRKGYQTRVVRWRLSARNRSEGMPTGAGWDRGWMLEVKKA